jgi:NAD(P) transhydrogenase subunit beta
MSALAIANAAYIAAALLFIMSLAGLSKHESGKSGIWYGMAGMAIAMLATIWLALSG